MVERDLRTTLGVTRRKEAIELCGQLLIATAAFPELWLYVQDLKTLPGSFDRRVRCSLFVGQSILAELSDSVLQRPDVVLQRLVLGFYLGVVDVDYLNYLPPAMNLSNQFNHMRKRHVDIHNDAASPRQKNS